MTTNGAGEVYVNVCSIVPGSIVRFGVDDDMTVMVLANFQSDSERRRLVYYGCFGDGPNVWEAGRLFSQEHLEKDTLALVFEPEVHG